MRRKLLPFYDDRKCKIDMLVLHCESYPVQKALDVFTKRKVSSHYIIDEDGEVWQLVGESHRAWHAGVSSWQGKTDINSRSIGIELVSPTLGQKNYPAKQREALIELVQKLVKKYKIKPQNIVGHSDVAPTRKADPGKCFLWKELAEKGFGIWLDKKLKYCTSSCDEKTLLQEIGYDVRDLNAAKLAFCRHFIPQSVVEDNDITNIENNLAETARKFKTPNNFDEILQNIAQQYAKASKTPCKI